MDSVPRSIIHPVITTNQGLLRHQPHIFDETYENNIITETIEFDVKIRENDEDNFLSELRINNIIFVNGSRLYGGLLTDTDFVGYAMIFSCNR